MVERQFNPIMINLNTLDGAETPLRSVRRTRIELRLIRKLARDQYDVTGDSIWIINQIMVAYDSLNDLIGLIQLDQSGKADLSKILVLEDDLILRSEAMSESQICKLIQKISTEDHWQSAELSQHDYFVIWVI